MMVENFPSRKKFQPEDLRISANLSRINIAITTFRHMIVKMLKIKLKISWWAW